MPLKLVFHLKREGSNINIKFNQPKGRRIYKGTIKVPHKNNRIPVFMGLENMDNNHLMWSDELDRWIGICNKPKGIPKGVHSLCSMSKPIRSVKAAVKHIKKHSEIPRGARMVLASSFVGYDVEIIK